MNLFFLFRFLLGCSFNNVANSRGFRFFLQIKMLKDILMIAKLAVPDVFALLTLSNQTEHVKDAIAVFALNQVSSCKFIVVLEACHRNLEDIGVNFVPKLFSSRWDTGVSYSSTKWLRNCLLHHLLLGHLLYRSFPLILILEGRLLHLLLRLFGLFREHSNKAAKYALLFLRLLLLLQVQIIL